MSGPLVLSLFPGIGLLDMAFEEEGFCVVRGPDPLWGGDVHRFHPPAGKFDGAIGGPPCKRWSKLAAMVVQNGYELAPNLNPEYDRVIREAGPQWFIREQVPAAPTPELEPQYRMHHQILRDVWVGGVTGRERRITFGTHDGRRLPVLFAALHAIEVEHTVVGDTRAVPVKFSSGGKRKRDADRPARTVAQMLVAQGLPPDHLDHCPLTKQGTADVVGQGVPLPMGRAIARAVKAAMGYETMEGVA